MVFLFPLLPLPFYGGVVTFEMQRNILIQYDSFRYDAEMIPILRERLTREGKGGTWSVKDDDG